MFYINNLIAFILLVGPIDEHGWASVERPQKNPLEQQHEEDPSIWPVFSKQFGSERVQVRFPDDPVYRYPALEQGDRETMEIESMVGGIIHRLNVLASPDQELGALIQQKIERIQDEEEAIFVQADQKGQTADLLYRSKGKWIRERFILTPQHLYILQTASETLSSEASHQPFIASFDLEIRGSDKVFHRPFQSEN